MKPEPLKNKIKNRMGCIYFNGKDVKSAVEGLKQTLITERKTILNNTESIDCFRNGYSMGITFAFQEINKWFEDVIK